jgi:hypothetical protein
MPAREGAILKEKPMIKSIVLITILIVAFTVEANGQMARHFAGEGDESGEAANAINRFGDLSRSEIDSRLRRMRPPAYRPGQVLIKEIIEVQNLPVSESKRVARLKAALQPVLDYHERGQIPIYVLQSEKPKAGLIDRAVIIITTRLMTIASDEEIRGIVAHELAHDYIWDEYVKAKREKDIKRMHECELFCDAVAAFTLKQIGDDPASYARILERMTLIGIYVGSGMRHESPTHPSLDARKRLNKLMSERLD